MIPRQCQPPPADFDRKVRIPGNRWLRTHPDAPASKIEPYWNSVRKEVQEAFDGCCAYLGFPITSGQVDHFIPKDVNRTLAYEWSNFRWSEARVNLLKRTARTLDPFEIQHGWITIDPATLLYELTNDLPEHLYAAGEETLRILNDSELVRGRRRALRPFVRADRTWNLEMLRDYFPLLAEAVEAFEREQSLYILNRNGPDAL